MPLDLDVLAERVAIEAVAAVVADLVALDLDALPAAVELVAALVTSARLGPRSWSPSSPRWRCGAAACDGERRRPRSALREARA